ncbi:MAG: hypothetical protein ACKO9Q_18225, partial [Pirellula sp.]
MVKAEPNQPLKYSILMPRIWHGMPAKVWFSNLARNRFAVSWSRLHYALGVSGFCPVSSMLAMVQ